MKNLSWSLNRTPRIAGGGLASHRINKLQGVTGQNYKELLTARFGIQSFGARLKGAHIKLLTDYTNTTITYLNNMWGKKAEV